MNEREASLVEHFEVTGLWWDPSTPDAKVHGRLVFDPHDDVIVDLDGRLGNPRRGLMGHRAWPVVHGETRNEMPCSLVLAEEQATSIGPRMQTSRVRARFCLLGCRFDSLQEIEFVSCTAECSNLTSWLGRRPFDEGIDMVSKAARSYSVSYHELPDVRFSLPDLGFTLRFSSWFSCGGESHHEAEMRHGESVIIRPKRKQSLRWFLDRLYEFRHLLTLLMMEPSRLEKVQVQYGSHRVPTIRKMHKDYATLLFRQSYNDCAIQDVPEFRIPFRYPSIKTHLKHVLAHWFGHYDRLGSVLGLFLLPIYNQHLNIEFRFLGLLQALEALHRSTVGGAYMTPDLYQDVRKRFESSIPSSVAKDHKNALRSRIKYGYEYSLRKRLTELAEVVTRGTMYKLTDGEDPKRFLRRVVDTRNFLTHYDESSRAASMSPREMVKANHSLTLFLMLLILHEIRVPVDLALDRLEESGLLRPPHFIDREDLP